MRNQSEIISIIYLKKLVRIGNEKRLDCTFSTPRLVKDFKLITFLFWNINKKPLGRSIANIVKHYDIDILILAENPIPDGELRSLLSKGTGNSFYVPQSRCKKISIFSKFSKKFFKATSENHRTTIQALNLPLRLPILIIPTSQVSFILLQLI